MAAGSGPQKDDGANSQWRFPKIGVPQKQLVIINGKTNGLGVPIWFGGYQYFRKPPYGYIAQQCPVVMIINDREFIESLNHKIQKISGGNRSAMIILIKNHQMAYQKWVYTILT
jgi:hypothetical protein